MVDDSSVDWSKLEEDAAPQGSIPGMRTQVITQDMLARRMVWDTVPCADAPSVANFLGLPATSDEVESMEHDESHARTAAVAMLLPYIELMANQTARVIAAAMIVDAEEAGVNKESEEFTDMADKMAAVVYMSAWGIVAELVDVNLLHLPHFATTSMHQVPES